MKLLLTSSGVESRVIADTLEDLIGKPAGRTKLGFIPTAANTEDGNKDWFINQFLKLWRYGYNWIDVVDPSADNLDWQKRLDLTDAVFISGGNTFHLLDQTRKTGLDKWLKDNKEKKVFIGSSAGSILFTPNIGVAATGYGDENKARLKDLTGLGWVDFEIAPHHEQKFVKIMKEYRASIKNPLYAIDDQTAIKIHGKKVEVITEGFWELYK